MPYTKWDDENEYKFEFYFEHLLFFSPDNFDPRTRQIYEVLRNFGVYAVRCRYDGGHDEGFAYFIEAILEHEVIPLKELKHQLVDSYPGEVPEAHLQSFSGPWNPRHYEQALPEERVERELNRFARVLAVQFLGQSYGTGDYSIFGSFQANLNTGEIVDEQRETL